MQKKLMIILKIFILTGEFFLSKAYADVLLNMSEADGISIENTSTNGHYTIKFEEPINPEVTANLIKKTKLIGALSDKNHLPYNNEVLMAAKETELPPALIHAVITVESQYNPHALSKRGAFGLMQLMPQTSQRFNVKNKFDPQQNILAGAKYLRELMNLFNGDVSLSLAAYNAGPATIQKYGHRIPPIKETLDYVPRVLKYLAQYS